MTKQTDQSSDDNVEFGSDGRRARLADLQRLEGRLAEAMGLIKALEQREAERETKPLSKPMFMAQVYAMSALAGKNVKHIRVFAEESYRDYCEALAGVPRKSLDEIYGGLQAPSAPMHEPVTLATGAKIVQIDAKVEAATA